MLQMGKIDIGALEQAFVANRSDPMSDHPFLIDVEEVATAVIAGVVPAAERTS